MSKKLTEKSLEKKLHNMGTEELIQIIVKETIGVGVNEKAVLRFYKTALSFTSISIFPW